MNKRALALPLALAVAVAWGAQAVLSDEEQAACDEQGGCVFITTEAIKTRMRAAYEAGIKKGGEECHKLTI